MFHPKDRQPSARAAGSSNARATEFADRRPMQFTEIYLGKVDLGDFRKNARGELGTRTATLHARGIAKLRQSWVYRV